MKKTLFIFLMSIIWISSLLTNVSAYELNEEQNVQVEKYISPTIESKVIKIVNKIEKREEKIALYNKLKPLIYDLKVKTLKSNKYSEKEKNTRVDLFTAFQYILEKHLLPNDMKPLNNTWDSI